MLYFDHSATTPTDPQVLDLMQWVAKENFGNPSSIHKFGQKARATIEKARRQVADALNAKPRNIIFTGSGTEANNMVLHNLLFSKNKHVITSAIEHPAIFKTLKKMKIFGVTVTIIPVDKFGLIKLEKIESTIQNDTGLITIMHANNEVGTIQPLNEISKIAKKHNIIFHSDAVQIPGKLLLDVVNVGSDLMSFSAHKFYGPKGVGFLYCQDAIKLNPLIIGGGQESKRRAGTENTAGITGLGLAMELASKFLEKNRKHLTSLEEHFKTRLAQIYPSVKFNGHPEKHLPGLVSATFPKIASEVMLVNLDMNNIAVSSGSACSSGVVKPSEVLKAMGISNELNVSTLRISFGKDNTLAEVDQLLDVISEILKKYSII